MRTWGEGNFDNDIAAAYLDDLIKELGFTIRRYIDDPEFVHFNLISDGEGKVMPSLDILVLLCQHYEVDPGISGLEVEEWKTAYLEDYDLIIDSPTPAYDKRERRMVIEATFERLAELARKYED
jgi:hypothetical protein